MKKLSLLLCFLLCAFASQATHLMGGDITVYRDSATQKYFVKVVHYRDTIGIPAAAQLTCKLVQWLPASNVWGNQINFNIDLDPAASGSALPSFPYGVEVYTYRDSLPTITLQPGSKYLLTVEHCCRNGAIMNTSAPLTESMVLYTNFQMPATGTNTSPQFLAMPIVYLPVNTAWTYNPLPYDVDGDSITWAIDTPVNMLAPGPGPNGLLYDYVAGYTAPYAAPSGPFSINGTTGQVSWMPNTQGNFVASFAITEWKAGVAVGKVIRDMQYVVVDSLAPTPQFSFVTSTPYQWDAAGGYAYVYYTPGQPLQFKIKGSDNGSAQMMMECLSSLFLRTPAPTFAAALTGAGNQIEGTLNWTPLATDAANKTVVFRLKNGVFTKDFTLLLKKNPAPASVASAAAGVEEFRVFPNPAGREISVSLYNEKPQAISVEVVDLTGKTVATLFRGTLQKGQWSMTEPLRCAPGFYLVQVHGEGGLLMTEKVVVK